MPKRGEQLPDKVQGKMARLQTHKHTTYRRRVLHSTPCPFLTRTPSLPRTMKPGKKAFLPRPCHLLKSVLLSVDTCCADRVTRQVF